MLWRSLVKPRPETQTQLCFFGQSFCRPIQRTRHISNLDLNRHTTILVELENRVTKGNEMHPMRFLEALNLAQK